MKPHQLVSRGSSVSIYVLLAIIINKLGDWNSNKKIQLAGTYKFIELFYGFYHAVYQKIEYRDLSQKFIMISVVKKQRTENFTYTISKNPNKHQGGDFILEGKVCQQKILAFKGVDLEEIWREVVRSVDDIEEVSTMLNEKMSLHEVGGSRNVNIKFGIFWTSKLNFRNS